jgi:hypothetical protein
VCYSLEAAVGLMLRLDMLALTLLGATDPP